MEKKGKLLSKRILAFVLTFAMTLVVMPSISARAEEPTNTWSYDEATNTITINCEVPTSFNIGSNPSMEFTRIDSTHYILDFSSYFGIVVVDGGVPYNGKNWSTGPILIDGISANREYGFMLYGHFSSTAGRIPKIKFNGHEFQSVLLQGNEFFAAISLGVLDESGNLNGGDLGGGSTPMPNPTPTEAKPDMTTMNIEGATFNSWEEITANIPNLTTEKLQKVNGSNDDLFHVSIVGKEDKTVPATAVAAMEKSSIRGLHVFIGESDAVTFLNNIDYSKYTGMNFKHDNEVTENSKTIDFTSKGKINAVLVFHTLIAPDKKAYVYKVVDGKEVLVGTASSNSNGGFCFAIDELAKYVIKY